MRAGRLSMSVRVVSVFDLGESGYFLSIASLVLVAARRRRAIITATLEQDGTS